MLTQADYGCGRSWNWEHMALDLATKLNEKCDHLSIYSIFIKSLPPKNEDKDKVKFEASCLICKKTLEKTSEKLTKKLNKFPGQ